MSEVMVWVGKTTIPTYEIGEAEKNPIFLDKRVYQGSSGKVYPYPTIEKISDVKIEKEYTAVYLENEYLKIMVLPELGGRIQRAYDKTNQYDFVYYNQVIKPALVGLTGPWISGGIEFNWPQHHRPTTYQPVDYILSEQEDGSKSVMLHDVDQMYGTKSIAKLTLYPGKAYIEITGQLYNRTALPQTFLWWANPAIPVNDNTKSIFPPDVHAVMDHGKRDVSRFPIATGTYYKKDYSEGVDISCYKNIPVPTSYMAEKSKYDFVGGYDYGKEAGILHIADHHISPGKKQWTWGCGDFGKAWDRNLTDEDGPYVELMTGVYTDNQPDFTWLKPFEEKTFKQYFMPYKAVGQVKNATIEAAINLSCEMEAINILVYATSVFENAEILLTYDGQEIFKTYTKISPIDCYKNRLEKVDLGLKNPVEEKLKLCILADGKCLVEYQPETVGIPKMPESAKAAKDISEIMSNEELYLTGLHIEQYRHATYLPDPYYLEGLKRDNGDIRINNAYGSLLMRRGQFTEAEKYFRKALVRLTERNPNPYDSEAYYLLGLVLFYQEKYDEAYDIFYKATWSSEQQEMSFYYLAAIDSKRQRYTEAYNHIEKVLVKNSHNIKARGLKAYILRKIGRTNEAYSLLKENLMLDPFDFISGNEWAILSETERKINEREVNEKEANEREVYERKANERKMNERITNEMEARKILNNRMRNFKENYLMASRDYAEFGAYEEAVFILQQCTETYPMLKYYEAYYTNQLGKTVIDNNLCNMSSKISMDLGISEKISITNYQVMHKKVENLIKKAEEYKTDYCFPNKLEDIAVLLFATRFSCGTKAKYYLGCLFYDKLQWEEAIALWESSAEADSSFPAVYRNLSLAYYNKRKNKAKAKAAMEKAFALAPSDARIFLELDQLYKKLGMSFENRLKNYEEHKELIKKRDDLYIEYITLVNMSGDPKKAYECINNHNFHPWEGGEGKVTTQYILALSAMAELAYAEGCFTEAESLLHKALIYPENLGEGKLEGTKDNNLYYQLGLVLEAQGKTEEAKEYFLKATIGTNEPAGAMYYNDQPADMILYQGLAFIKLGKTAEAKARFYRLIDYGEQHLEDEVKIDYFAVSLPDFLIFDDDYSLRNRVHCYYLMALGNIGLGNIKKAEVFITKAVTLEPCHIMCRVFQERLSVLVAGGASAIWIN